MENIKKVLIQNPYVSLLVKLALLPLLPIVLIFSCLFPCISLPLVYVYRKNIINHIKQDYRKSKELTYSLIEIAKQSYQTYIFINIKKVKVEMERIVKLIENKYQNLKIQITQYIEEIKIIQNVTSMVSSLFDLFLNILIKQWKFLNSIINQTKEKFQFAIYLILELATITLKKCQEICNLTIEYIQFGINKFKDLKNNERKDNFGYALLNENGTTINNLDRSLESKRFSIQLYHYVTSQFWKHKNLNGLSVFDLDFGEIDAINYIYQQMKPKQYIVGSDNEQKIEQFNQKYNEEKKNISNINLNLLKLDLQNQQFDIITNIQKINKYQDLKQIYQQIPQLLTDNGHFMVCDYKRYNEWEQFEQIINECGLKVVEKMDITLNVKQAIKLQYNKGYKEQKNLVTKLGYRIFQKYPKEYQQLQNREILYMVYDLQKKI